MFYVLSFCILIFKTYVPHTNNGPSELPIHFFKITEQLTT